MSEQQAPDALADKSTLFGDTPASQVDRLQAQLAAVALLAARTDRDKAHHDILVSTVIEVLEAGPLSRPQIRQRVAEIWPQSMLTDFMFEETVNATLQLGLVGETGDIAERLELCPAGRECLDESTQHAKSAVGRFSGQVADQLTAMGQFADSGALALIVTSVTGALRTVVADALRPASGGELANLGTSLHVAGVSANAIDEHLAKQNVTPESAERVRTLVSLCLDQTQTIGNEIVHDLVVGHLLYLFMARADLVAATSDAGPLTGELLVIDTPILLRMLGPKAVSDPIRSLLANAKQLGIDVALYSETVEELERSLTNTGLEDVPPIDAELDAGGDQQVFERMHRGQEAVRYWLRWRQEQPTNQDHSYAAWRSSTSGDAAAILLLKSIGIEPRTKEFTFEASMRFQAFQDQLTKQVERNGVRFRSAEVVRHDAMNLTRAWMARSEQPPTKDKVWPGSFILTPDGQLNEAYDTVAGAGPFPIALTFPQCARIVGAYSSAPVSERLAFDLADGITEQIVISRAVHVDAEQAALIVAALRSENTSAADIEQMKLDLSKMLDDADSRGETDQAAIAAGVAERLRERRRAAREFEQRRSSEADMQHEVLRAKMHERDKTILELSSTNIDLQATNDARESKHRDELEWQQGVATRQTIAVGALVALAAIAVILGVVGAVGPAVVVSLAFLGGIAEYRSWVHREKSLVVVVIGVAVVVASLWALGMAIAGQ